ncbi:glycosyltransferase family 4 protein [Loigolactobacillus jiayinensis]|uniref:Glycosyltransferase family 4 protein n=1 Tax=Loigolactobacillus jiayinensis TaxID=2486016 RepID=A0ABW1RDJ3_9LACO|nr:glycosyltransferase family 4 protein [Loigolactobacillus jiayinensis]
MLDIHMFSSATKVKGQGVGSAYMELVRLLKSHFKNEFKISVNQFGRADISHYHTIDPRFFLSTFSRRRGRKIGYVHFLPETLEGSLTIPQPFKSIFYHYVIAFYRRMDHLVVVNPSFIPKLIAYQIPANKITYIPNFVSRKEFYQKTPEEIAALRQHYQIAADKFVILGAGQIQERKGVDDFVELARRNPDIQFIWAGGFSFGKMTEGYQRYKKIVDAPPANLRFTGIVERSELVNFYNISDLFLLPSYNELFPMSVLESFACGTPVLLRDLSLYRSIIAGYYVGATDVDAMNQQIADLRQKPAALSYMQQQARAAADYYSEERLAEIWHRFYVDQAREG